MPTVIALDTSLSMQSCITDGSGLTYHQLASDAIRQLLKYLTRNSKLEQVCLVCFSLTAELKVDFTRDYKLIRKAVKNVEISTKSNVLGLLQFVGPLISKTWSLDSYCHVVLFTDCPIGFRDNLLQSYAELKSKTGDKDPWLKLFEKTKINLVGLSLNKKYNKKFLQVLKLYNYFFESCGLKYKIFTPIYIKDKDKNYASDHKRRRINTKLSGSNSLQADKMNEQIRSSMWKMVHDLCVTNYKPMEILLKCGSYFRLECPITLWPQFPSYYGFDVGSCCLMSRLEVCGYLSIADIGSPASLSRHVILPVLNKQDELVLVDGKYKYASHRNDLELLENDMRNFYIRDEDCSDDENAFKLGAPLPKPPTEKESLIVLLYKACKADNVAALVLLNDNWYAYIFVCPDSDIEQSLLLNVLPPGNNVIPWLGDLRSLCIRNDPDEVSSSSEPNNPWKNYRVWLTQSSLHSNIEKLLTHAKNMPEETQSFFTELNLIRFSAIALGFIDLFEALAKLFEKECEHVLVKSNPICVLQLTHAAAQLRRPENLDHTKPIFPAATLTEVNANNSNASMNNIASNENPEAVVSPETVVNPEAMVNPERVVNPEKVKNPETVVNPEAVVNPETVENIESMLVTHAWMNFN
ncbi:integrator complex subunit 14-like [Teleopsis dalmanni]|uniref:integrator complex subunit 14-like n=1 Tax=Teleopsis dalmanni TaxID=139649 RepID=UPI0018CEF0E8|nr:integrator complex subunit 14-like [Teleopsis dalmanni]